MKRSKRKPSRNDSPAKPVEGELNKDELAEIALQKTSAEYYERRWKDRIKEHQSDFWIVLGVYLIISSVAIVIL